jgi:hypothetical protein
VTPLVALGVMVAVILVVALILLLLLVLVFGAKVQAPAAGVVDVVTGTIMVQLVKGLTI